MHMEIYSDGNIVEIKKYLEIVYGLKWKTVYVIKKMKFYVIVKIFLTFWK